MIKCGWEILIEILNQWKKKTSTVYLIIVKHVYYLMSNNKWMEEKTGLRDPSQVGEKSSLKLGFCSTSNSKTHTAVCKI